MKPYLCLILVALLMLLLAACEKERLSSRNDSKSAENTEETPDGKETDEEEQ